MQIADSKLFQEFSGQFLREMYGRGPLSVLSDSLSGGMDGVVQYLMNRSSLEVIAVNIRNATKDSFNISIECRVTGTGPISSTVAPMTVDLLFNSSQFGRMRLPEIHTSAWGTTVLIMEQEVAVSDMDTYRAYVRSIITAEETSFRLDNGDCKIRALGLGAGCKYGMEVPMRGMDGLRAELDSIERTDDEQISVGLRLQNPSPVQIDHGVTTFEIRTVEGVVVARLSGSLQILRGTFTVSLRGSLMDGEKRTESTRLRFMGVGTKDASWCNETIQYIDTVVETKEKHRRAFGLDL